MSLKVLLNGAKGRMGRAIAQVAPQLDAQIVAEVDQDDDPATFIKDCEVIIDFSFHEITLPLARLALKHKKPLVIGTTGHSSTDREAIVAMTAAIPIVWSGNYSTGINLLYYLTSKAARILDAGYNPEVVEMHHRLKKDAPSGTAAHLIEILRKARALSPEQTRYGRQGLTGERPEHEIGVHALRGGDVVGEHTVMFAGPGERIELTHRATDRVIFARGALSAAHWVSQKAPGLYSMQDVLGLEP